MICHGWCGHCYAFVRGRVFSPCSGGRRRVRRLPSARRASMLRRNVPSPGVSAAPGVPGVGWPAAYPTVWEFISLTSWPDAAPRVPGSVVLFCEDGVWKACLSDKDAGLVAFVASGDPEGLLEAMEEGLAAGRLDWRKSRTASSGKSRKST